MVLPLFRKCCPQRPNRVDIESTELQTNPTIHNEAQTDCGPKINPQRCSALVQMALAETVNELGSTDLGSKLSDIINSVEFQNFMDELMEFVKTRSPEQLTYTVNSSNQLKKTEELAVNVELKRRMHEKIFYLGDKRLTAIRTIANQTTEQAPAVNIRTTIGSTSASIADGDQKESESDKDERDSVFPLLSKNVTVKLHTLCLYTLCGFDIHKLCIYQSNYVFSSMWRFDGSSLRDYHCIRMDFCF